MVFFASQFCTHIFLFWSAWKDCNNLVWEDLWIKIKQNQRYYSRIDVNQHTHIHKCLLMVSSFSSIAWDPLTSRHLALGVEQNCFHNKTDVCIVCYTIFIHFWVSKPCKYEKKSPLSSCKATVKQQLKGEKLWDGEPSHLSVLFLCPVYKPKTSKWFLWTLSTMFT